MEKEIDKQKLNTEVEFHFEFIPDQPLRTEDELAAPRFGHKEIAKALAKSVQKCPTPFTIGLFGKWGAGKSSIANLLRKDLEENKIPVVIFDVWKHQGDALRRTFLKESLSQLKKKKYGVDGAYELDERLDKTIQRSKTAPRLKFPWKEIKIAFVLLTLALLIFAAVDGYFLSFRLIKSFWNFIAAIVGIGAIIIFVSYVLKAVQHLISTTDFVLKSFVSSKAVSYTVDKFQDPQDFEEEFGNLIKALKSKRLVVVFDNLDRVTHKRAVEVLTTIKTFLEPKDLEIYEKEVVFVIPCDADAIRKHIESVYKVDDKNNTAFSQEEFLKKFFNTIFWIPEFIPTELEAYTKEMLQSTKVKDLDNNKVAWIITKAYRENPRQIKQFINILLANYLLVRERQGEGTDFDFPLDFLEKNTSQLSKFLLLYQCFPDDIEKIRKSRIADLQDAVNQQDLGFGKEFDEFVEETTSDFPIYDLRIFFTLRRSAQEKEFPGIEDFFISLEDKKIASVEAYLERIKDFDDVQQSFSQVIEERLRNITNDLSLASLIATLLEALDSQNLTLADVGYREIVQRLTHEAKAYFHTVKPSVLSKQIAEPFGQYKDEILKAWHSIIVTHKSGDQPSEINEEYWMDLFSVIADHSDWFETYKEDIKEVLTNRFSQRVWAAELFSGKPDDQKLFLSNQFITNFINSISSEDIEKEALAHKIDLIFGLEKELFDVNSYTALSNKVNELISYESNHPLDDEREAKKLAVFDELEDVIVNYEDEFKQHLAGQGIWINIKDSLINAINQIPDWDAKKIVIPLILFSRQFVQEPQNSELKEIVINFINSASAEPIEYVLGKLENEQQFIENSEFAETLGNRALTNQEVFDSLYKKISDDKKSEWLLKLLQTDHVRLINKLKSESFKVPHAAEISNALLDSLVSHPPQEQRLFFEAINSMKCSGQSDQKDKYAAILKGHLTNLDHEIQEVGLAAISGENFLGKTRLRNLTKELFDWLKTPEVSSKYQPFTISAIVRGYDDNFNDEERNEFLQFVFDELIRKKSNETVMRFGFDQLTILKPKYEERKDNYDDIRARIESEQDENVRVILIQEMKKLRKVISDKRNKPTKDFWTGIEGLELESPE